MEEPLRVAQSRMQEKLDKEFAAAVDEWQICEYGKNRTLRSEFYYPRFMFAALRGANDNLKFERIFSEGAHLAPEFDRHRMGCKAFGLQTSQARRSARVGMRSPA